MIESFFKKNFTATQRSREQWIKLGGINTKYFHAQTVVKKKCNRICGLHLPDGNWCSDESILKDEAQKFNQKFFCATPEQRPNVVVSNDVVVRKLPNEATDLSTQEVTRDEVTKALNQRHAY